MYKQPMLSAAVFTLLSAAYACAANAQAPQTPPTPEQFTRFEFPGNENAAKTLNDYLWYHFVHRLGNGPSLFNKEYLMVSDLWLNEAIDPQRKKPIQEVHREDLLAIDISPEGYVNTHQHFSHAHDLGWPFPMWTQAGWNADQVAGKAAGWHFQDTKVPGWVGDALRGWKRPEYVGSTAAERWELENAQSLGIVNERWQVKATGPSPALLTPKGMSIEVVNAPFMQLRWTRTGTPPGHAVPYMEWTREGDTEFSPERRAYFYPEKTPLSTDGLYHSILPMHRHPLWKGTITRMRLCLAPGETDVTFDIDSFFCAYDTRHTINNPIFVIASYDYFSWTGDLDFLRQNINRMRTALRHQQTEMGGLEHNYIRNPWPGHDGLAGWVRNPDGTKTIRPGRGIGNNYWDIMPFGGDDFYATYQYYAATLKMAEIEAAVRSHQGWDIPLGALALDADALRKHAEAVKETANRLFWNPVTGRFFAAIDQEGVGHDYGFTFLNLDSIWYDIATPEHAQSISDWIRGKRTVEGDTSTGADIYHWRFGPRATTRRNEEWYGQGWNAPESLAWGAQVQDGGAVLGFTFYDLWARLRVAGSEDAWQRLLAILDWQREVQQAGGYRAYYADGKHGATLQGGGTAGGLGIDAEFFESSLLSAIVPYGFAGIDARPEGLFFAPQLPESCPEMSIRDLWYRGVRMDVQVKDAAVELNVKDAPLTPLSVSTAQSKEPVVIQKAGSYVLPR